MKHHIQAGRIKITQDRQENILEHSGFLSKSVKVKVVSCHLCLVQFLLPLALHVCGGH